MTGKILIIDDDPGILWALEMALQDAGYETETAAKYTPALEQDIVSDLPALIILDILLAGYDGRDICRKLKDQPATAHVPVMLTSAHPNARSTSFEAGADDFLPKPFDIDDLLSRIRRVLRTEE
jgi:DNA-binding response OmpR family regulator